MGSTRRRPRDVPKQRPVEELVSILEPIVGGSLDEALLRRALTHRSFSYENGGVPHNERLEFLGDAVLGLVMTDHLYRGNPDMAEGQLAKIRAAVVNSRALAEVATTLDLGAYLILGKGEEATGGRKKSSILADTTEAVIGAVYEGLGLEAGCRLVHHLLDDTVEASVRLGAGLDWKTSLQEASAAAGLGVPRYEVTSEGPDHDKRFRAEVILADEVRGSGEGRSKKLAEQEAAATAWKALQDSASA